MFVGQTIYLFIRLLYISFCLKYVYVRASARVCVRTHAHACSHLRLLSMPAFSNMPVSFFVWNSAYFPLLTDTPDSLAHQDLRQSAEQYKTLLERERSCRQQLQQSRTPHSACTASLLERDHLISSLKDVLQDHERTIRQLEQRGLGQWLGFYVLPKNCTP